MLLDSFVILFAHTCKRNILASHAYIFATTRTKVNNIGSVADLDFFVGFSALTPPFLLRVFRVFRTCFGKIGI